MADIARVNLHIYLYYISLKRLHHAARTTMINGKMLADWELKKYTPYLALTGESYSN